LSIICHVVYECLPGAYAGGVQKVAYELAVAQAKQGDTVEIWTMGNLPERRESGVLIRYFGGNSYWGSPEMRKALRDEQGRFDVIHSHNTFHALNRYVAALAREKGTRVYFHAHGTVDPQLLSGWSAKALKKRLYVTLVERRNYDAGQGAIGLTATECHQLEQTGIRTAIFQVGNGIAVQPQAESFSAAAFRLKHRITLDGPVVLFIGRITHKKGIHKLIDAFPAVLAHFPNAQLVICGGRGQDIEYVRQLDRQVAQLGLHNCIRWAGFLDEVGKRAAFASGSVFVHPSYSEGMALAILEAMSAAVPVIVTPGCYMDAAVEAGAVRLSENTPDELAASIVDVLQNEGNARALATRGIEYIQEYHTWDAVARRLTRIYAGDPDLPPHRARLA
jgi:glycosyltransferase involved in cell wall biosynthesis